MLKIVMVLLIGGCIIRLSLDCAAKNINKAKDTCISYIESQDSINVSFHHDTAFTSLWELSDSEFINITYLKRHSYSKIRNADSFWNIYHYDTFKISRKNWFIMINRSYYLYFSADSFLLNKDIKHWYYPNYQPYKIWEPLKMIKMSNDNVYVFKSYDYQGGKALRELIYFNPKIGIERTEVVEENDNGNIDIDNVYTIKNIHVQNECGSYLKKLLDL